VSFAATVDSLAVTSKTAYQLTTWYKGLCHSLCKGLTNMESPISDKKERNKLMFSITSPKNVAHNRQH
jgi:hypothetical protein